MRCILHRSRRRTLRAHRRREREALWSAHREALPVHQPSYLQMSASGRRSQHRLRTPRRLRPRTNWNG